MSEPQQTDSKPAFQSSKPPLPVVLALFCIALLFLSTALVRGEWLDEFWTLHLSDSSRGWKQLVQDGWLKDPHPPLFSILTLLLRPLVGDTIMLARLLINGIMLCGLLLFIYRLAGRKDRDASLFYWVFLLLVLSMPGPAGATEAFSNFRSYFLQIGAMIILLAWLRSLFERTDDLTWRAQPGQAIIALLICTFPLQLHYFTTLFAGLTQLCAAILLWRAGRRGWAGIIMLSLCLSAPILLWCWASQSAYLKQSQSMDWIAIRNFSAGIIMAKLILYLAAHNPIASWAAWQGRAKLRLASMPPYVITLLFGLLGGLTILLLANMLKPLLVDRYLVGAEILACALITTLATPYLTKPKSMMWVALCAVLATGINLFIRPAKPGWRDQAQMIASVVTKCAETKIYAVNGWALSNRPASLVYTHEQPVFALGYRFLAANHHFPVTFVPMGQNVTLFPAKCPSIIWIAHQKFDKTLPPAQILSRLQFHMTEPVSVSKHLFNEGVVLLAQQHPQSASTPVKP